MAHKSGLGKGLDALIPGGETLSAVDGILQIAVSQISPNPRQPRTHFDEVELESLAASIREVGVLEPLILQKNEAPGEPPYLIIAGERRWKAAGRAGLEAVPAILRNVTDQQRLELALIENVQRADLSPLETAEAYRQLSDDFSLTQEEIATRVGKSRVSVTNTLRLLKLPATVQTALAEGKISEGHARALLALPTPQAQSAALQAILTKELNVRQTEELVRRLGGQRAPHPDADAAQTPEITALEERLCSRLGTRVNLRHSAKGGTLTIHYYSDEELDSIIALFLNE
jgi:ParB family chromosome partitioning protein